MIGWDVWELPIFVCANRVRSRPSSSVTCGDTFPAGEGFGRVRTLIVAVLQVKASCFSRTVGDAGPYKFVRTGFLLFRRLLAKAAVKLAFSEGVGAEVRGG